MDYVSESPEPSNPPDLCLLSGYRSVRDNSSLAGLHFVSRTRFGAASQLLARRERKGKEGNKINFRKFSGDPSKSVIFAGVRFKTDRNPADPIGSWQKGYDLLQIVFFLFEMSTFSTSRNDFLLYVYWYINIFTLQK